MKNLALALIFSLLFIGVAYAQDATAEVTVEATPTAVATEVAVPPVVVVPTEPTPENEAIGLGKFLLAIAALFTLGTKALNIASSWVEGKNKDTSFVSGAEIAGKYAPGFVRSAAKEFLKAFIRLGGNLQALLDEATDDVPYVVKVTLPPSGSATNLNNDAQDKPNTPQG
jgi:hypothetical protein